MNIDRLMNRPGVYAAEDGVAELVMGLSWVVVGVAWLIVAVFPAGSDSARTLLWVAQAVWFAASLGMAWGIKKLKERVTYPRGGYVALEEPRVRIAFGWSRRTVAVLLALPCVAAIAVVTRYWPRGLMSSQELIVGALCALVTYAYVAGALRYGLKHWWWLAGCSAVLGVGFFAISPGLCGIPAMLVCQGAMMAIAGGVRLRSFVKSHPIAS